MNITDEMQLQRPQVMRGTIVFPNGNDYYYGSGSPKNIRHPSCPLGSSRIELLAAAPTLPGKEGYPLVGAQNAFDPLVQRVRKEIMIHQGRTDDSNLLQSWGCLSVQASSWEYFKSDMSHLMEFGDVYLNVHPGGHVTVTLHPLWDIVDET